MNGGPLLNKLFPIAWDHAGVGSPMPDRDRRDVAAFGSSHINHAAAPFRRRLIDPRIHASQRLAHRIGAAIRDAGNDSATGEALGVCGEHSCGHRAAGGQANDVDARTVHGMTCNHRINHLPDRQRLAAIARRVLRLEPVEAGVLVVGAPQRHEPWK